MIIYKFHKYILVFFIGIFIGWQSYSQTPLMSQSFIANNFFNPATVGFGTNSQIQSFFRNQFDGVGYPYRTIGIGVDFSLSRNEKNNFLNNMGIGIQGVSEQVLNGALQKNDFTISVANRIFLNNEKTSSIALGISSTLISRNIDKSVLTFSDQYYSGRLFNNSSLESISDYPTKYSTNFGLMYTKVSPNIFIQIGGSTYYINRTAISQIYENLNQTYQFNSTLNFEHTILDNHTFFVHANYQYRFETEFVYLGGAIGFPLQNRIENNNRFYLGCLYRSKDAIIPYIGLLFNKYKLGLTYDIYNNKMTNSNLHPQTLEITLLSFFGKNYSKNLKGVFN